MNSSLTIGLTGDVMLGRTLDTIISQKGHNYPWGDVLPLLMDTDLNLINLETTLTDSERKVYKTFNFKSSPDNVQSLVNANVTIANLANNHILDFAHEGLLQTIETLNAAGIKHVGAGKNLDEAVTPVVVQRKNFRVGVLGLTDNEPGWKADNGPGTNYVDLTDTTEKARVLHTIRNLQQETDIIIVSIHWGPNMQEIPEPAFIDFAHAMIDHGAHVIHGHSAHIMQGVECYRNRLILYDTGDFVDDYVVDPELRNDLSAFYVLTISKSGLMTLKVVPVRIFEYQVNRARSGDYEWVTDRLKILSSPFGTHITEQGKIEINPAERRTVMNT
jgi:poly-gamma-glutamate capsule biosynthesis protein CapA/YwtB (metallophosphatase superfamily)